MAMIVTAKGLVDDSRLERKVSRRQGPTGVMEAEEYWMNGELVKRSAEYHPGARLVNGEIVR